MRGRRIGGRRASSPSDLKVYADLSGLGRGRYNLPVRFDPPADVTITGVEPAQLDVTHPLTWPPRLFGTDGIRGTAGAAPLDPPTVRRIGAAIVQGRSSRPTDPPRLLIGRDTRESGDWIERELAHGARLCRRDVVTVGVLPTPAVAYLTRSHATSRSAP